MNSAVIFVESGRRQRPELKASLEANGFQVLPCRSILDLEKLCREEDRGVVILDLDAPVMNNRVLRDVKRKRPALQIIGTSSRSFHPELKEAFSSHIYACLCGPIDPEELIYLVKSILGTPVPPE